MAYGAIREKTGGRDVGQWNPTTEQSAAFESATQGMSPAQKAQLSNLFRSVADREAGQLGSSQRMGGTGKSPVQPQRSAPALEQGEMGLTGGRGTVPSKGPVGQGEVALMQDKSRNIPLSQGEMAAVENWLRTPEAQQFLGGGGAPVTGDPAQRGGMPRSQPYPQGENLADQQLQKTLDERAGLIAHIQGMMSQQPPNYVRQPPNWMRLPRPGMPFQQPPNWQTMPRAGSPFEQPPQNRGWLGGY